MLRKFIWLLTVPALLAIEAGMATAACTEEGGRPIADRIDQLVIGGALFMDSR